MVPKQDAPRHSAPRFRRVAVTGGAGYVGSVLVPSLIAAGYEVKVIDLFLYGDDVLDVVADSPRLHLVKADIRDERMLHRELRGMDAVIHLACVSNDPSFELDPAMGKSINYDAFLGLVRAMRENHVARCLYASSSSVYGLQDRPDVREDTPCRPLTDYSKYKLLCEEVLASSDLGRTEYVVIRPATVCGDAPRLRLDLTVNILTIHALTRREIVVYGGDQLRPNINIQDMARAYLALLEAPRDQVHRATFNVGYENFSVADLARRVRQVVGDDTIPIRVEPTDDRRSYHINSDTIKDVLGFVPHHTIEEAVHSLCDAYRQGRISEPLTNPKYYNIKMMQQVKLKSHMMQDAARVKIDRQ